MRATALLTALLTFPLATAAHAAGEMVIVDKNLAPFDSMLDGEKWLALCQEGTNVTLMNTDITVVPVDPATGGPNRLEIARCGRPIALVRGLDLKAGVVATAVREEVKIEPGNSIDLTWHGDRIHIAVTHAPEDDQNTITTMTHGSMQQKVFVSDYCEKCTPRLLWAGDIDRDGGLDLLLGAGTTSDNSQFFLFTSKGKADTELVRRVASYVTSGS